ncbi:glycoside hydrolase family 28 protein [Flavilitoribacter nigricans]|uniref:Glycoside hydrolase n=1 Tax=Flavilitoribacter nigricans (strain ATCC 23147 / DSM 23189 / NBRC 102662 / NCIMB 1420 / SS-2) TaxID=1122177 RepID=A0A2D0MZN6_FLAN2|nr:glycoside hydrolase family 28 protein [Flavilitoribacter nigricans]PHN01640.1 glycoside hydrolase [Flavilitoribacter nigricans DSM 23189 = NBRC 102662]
MLFKQIHRFAAIFFAGLLTIGVVGCKSAETTEETTDTTDHWAGMEAILAEINPPEFRDATYDITEFGATADSDEDALPAIKAAIEACVAEGGGQVLIPPGNYVVNGPIHLRSNINLHVAEGANVKFSTEPSDYLPVVMTRWEGVECYNYSALIYAYEQENIAITGTGTLDGQASEENWWPWCGKGYGHEEGMPSQMDDHSRPKLYGWNDREVPVEERILGEGSYLRPNFIQPYKCKNILIDGPTLRNSPMWVMNPVLSENVTIQNVTVISHGPNSDGCDPESCKNVLIKNCFFDTGDDCIALKSGRNQDGRNIGRPIENVIVQGCEMKDGHGGVVIGSEVSGGARNIYAENCTMDSPNLDRAIRVKTNKIRGGTIENLFFRNITVGEVKEAVVRINMRYAIFSDATQEYIPEINNIYVENVTSKKSKYGVLIDGYSDEHPVKGLHLKNCRFDGVADGNKIEYATDLSFEDYYLNGELVQQ